MPGGGRLKLKVSYAAYKEEAVIPAELSSQHVIRALQSITRDGVPNRRHSHRHCLQYNGRDIPPKYVVSIAYRQLTGTELAFETFNAGDAETNKRLRQLGFSVV